MWQKCPVCNSQVQVLMCRTCKGHGIINELTGLPPANEKPLEKKKKKEKFNYRQYLRESLDNAFNAEINKYLSGNDIDHFSLSKNQEELIKQMDLQPLQFDKAKIKEQAQQRNEACYPKTPKECKVDNKLNEQEQQSLETLIKQGFLYEAIELAAQGYEKYRNELLKTVKEMTNDELSQIEIVRYKLANGDPTTKEELALYERLKALGFIIVSTNSQPLSSTNGQTEINKLQIAIDLLEDELYCERMLSESHIVSAYEASLLKYITKLKAKKDGLLKTKDTN